MHHAFTDMLLKIANGNAQGFWGGRMVWQASLPWPYEEPEFYLYSEGWTADPPKVPLQGMRIDANSSAAFGT